MKAKTVNENINFNRGSSVKDSIGIGPLAKYGNNPEERIQLRKLYDKIKEHKWIETGDWGLDADDIKKWTKPINDRTSAQHQMTLYRTGSDELYLEFRVVGKPSYDIYHPIGDVIGKYSHKVWVDTE